MAASSYTGEAPPPLSKPARKIPGARDLKDREKAVDVVEALISVIRKERASLVALAQREGVKGEDAFDCVHDAFVTFLRLAVTERLPDDEEAVRPILRTVVRNAARNGRRKHRTSRPHDSLEALGSVPLEDESHEDADELLARAEEHVRLRACVEKLCDTQRAVVTLRLLEERRGDEVADALGLSRSHVDVLVHRAKRALLTCMVEEK